MKLSGSVRVLVVLLLVLALVPVTAEAQARKKKKKKKASSSDTAVVEVVEMFEQNQLADLVAAVNEAKADDAVVNGDAVYLQGLALERLQKPAEARVAYADLAARPEADVWHWVGRSASALADGDTTAALEAANRAVETSGDNEYTHYQRGLVLVKRAEYGPAAEAFVRTLQIDGDFAYAHYYAGMSYHQVRNLMATGDHLRRFLQLVPEAPEKLAVQSILATIGG